MLSFDVAIIGKGLSGSILTYFLLQKKYRIIVFDVDNFSSTKASAGEINPVTGRYFKLTKDANEIIPFAINFYRNVEAELQAKFIVGDTFVRHVNHNDIHQIQLNIQRDKDFNKYVKISDVNELNQTFTTKGLCVYPEAFLNALEKYFSKKILVEKKYFEAEQLLVLKDYFEYQNFSFKSIIFAEGYNAAQNIFCKNEIDFVPYKGQAMLIRSHNLNIKHVLKKEILLVPFFENLYWVGTENTWSEINYEINYSVHAQIIQKFNTHFPDCVYEILKPIVGIRPSVRNRIPQCKPLKTHKKMFVFNGFGTKGFSLIPFHAHKFVQAYF